MAISMITGKDIDKVIGRYKPRRRLEDLTREGYDSVDDSAVHCTERPRFLAEVKSRSQVHLGFGDATLP